MSRRGGRTTLAAPERMAANGRSTAGFTLIEILLALSLLGMLTVMLFTSFYSVTRSWEAGRSAIDAAGHADYLMEQLSAALRSAYTPGVGEKYGLVFTDDGEDASARDIIEWTKIGPALIGEDAEFTQVPHRVRVTVTDKAGDNPGGFTVRAWRQDLQLDEFDPETEAAELCLSSKVVGFNCRMLDSDQEKTLTDELNWVDEWAKTNTLPTVVELTLWMAPAEKGGEPVENKRIVEIPMGPLSQNPSLGSSSTEEARRGTSTSVGGGGRRRTNNMSQGNQGGNHPGGGQGSGQGNGQGRPGSGGQGSMMPPGGGFGGGMGAPGGAPPPMP